MSEVVLKFNDAALNALLKGPEGPVAKHLAIMGARVESAAKRNASGRPGPNVITGRLRNSIAWRIGRDGEGLYCDIGSNVEYAGYVELGTRNAPAYPYLRPALSAANF